jgi:hypothetical protein
VQISVFVNVFFLVVAIGVATNELAEKAGGGTGSNLYP